MILLERILKQNAWWQGQKIEEIRNYKEREFLGKLPHLAENLVCLHLNAKWFWKKYTEIDFYFKKIPIEVKYTETKPDIKNLLLAATALKSKKILVITKDIEQKERRDDIEISYLPLWKFLLQRTSI